MTCIKWQLFISILMYVSGLISVCLATYYYQIGDKLLNYFFLAISSLFILCGWLLHSWSLRRNVHQEANKSLPKKVRFSSLLQIYDYCEQSTIDESNQGLLEDVQETSEKSTGVNNSKGGSKSERNVEVFRTPKRVQQYPENLTKVTEIRFSRSIQLI